MKRIHIVLGIPVAVMFLLFGGALAFTANAAYPTQNATAPQAQEGAVLGPFVSTAVKSDVSPPLRSLPVASGQAGDGVPNEHPLFPVPQKGGSGNATIDSVVQTLVGPLAMPTTIANFEGMFNQWGGIPPDTVGDVGPNHYVQQVNVGVQIWDKNGNVLGGPYSFNDLFRGFGGDCELRNQGDPVPLHDQMADRWFLSQFAFPSQSGPTYQCIAISTSPDPLGSYYRYAFQTAAVGFDDYPHYGVWPDAYYMAANRFNAPGFAGASVALERQRMLEGDPGARMVVFLTPGQGGHLPSDLDGGTLPPSGTPNFYLYPTSPAAGTINEYRFHVDWSNPALSTYLGPFPVVGVAPWDPTLCGAARQQCIDQPGTTARLEAISDRFMHRLTYRNFGTHEMLLATHTVDSNAPVGRAGKRWLEIRNPNSTPTVFQQGTYAPDDGLHRWMGSIAMDRQGNIALGYSVSSTTVYPSIRYTGRLVTDPPGTMGQGEATLFNGTGSEDYPAAPRWGDYSSMNVDPRDDCTFWYTQEYFRTTGLRNWRTRIGSFRFPECTGATATPVPSATGPVPTHTATPMPSPTICPGGTVVVGSITSTDPVQMGRVGHGSPVSSCTLVKTCVLPLSDNLPRNYDSYTYTNTTGSAQCVHVGVVQNCSDNSARSIAYLGSFDPNSICNNYLADGGSAGPSYSYSFTLGAGQTAVVVVYENSPNIGCESYTISISPCPVGLVTPSPTNTPSLITPTATATPPGCIPNYQTTTSTGAIIPGGADTGNHCDDCSTLVVLPFPVRVYERTFTTANLGSNGHIQFASNYQGFYDPMCMPVSVDPDFEYTFFPYYDDLRTDELVTCPDCGIFTQTTGSAPNRQFVIRWKTTYYNHPGTAEFEVILTENSDVLTVIYGASEDSGSEATSGIQRTETGPYTQFSCNQPALTNGLRVDYIPTGCPTPTVIATATSTSTTIPTTAVPTATLCPIEFRDVDQNNPFRIYIKCLACRGIVGGYADGTFRPYNNATRGQVSKFVSNAAGYNDDIPPDRQTFKDVPPSHPFWLWIERLALRGVIGGYNDPANCPASVGGSPCFRPERFVTRGQMAKFASNAAGFSDTPPAGSYAFTDVPPGHVFYIYIERLSRRGIISGYECGEPPAGPCDAQRRPWYIPGEDVTRGQLSKIIANTFFPECMPPPPGQTPPARP